MACKILIIEDNRNNLSLLKDLLSFHGYEIAVASDGQEGVRLALELKPDLILMDLRMPLMNGYEATKQIKSTEKGLSTPIIALTASAFDEDKKKAKLYGLQGYIRKPFRESELFGEIGKILGITYKYEADKIEISDFEEAETDENAIANLKKLPVNMLDNMLDAITKADMDSLLEVINSIDPVNSKLIKYLKYLAGNYDYNKIQQLIQKIEY